jgi:uncharacterized membrane protein YdfJ with MMPL/SSD domain
MRLGSSDQGNDPPSLTTRKAYDLLAQGFGPGFNGPLLVVADMRNAADQGALTRLSRALQQDPTVQTVAPPRFNQAHDTAVMVVIPKTAPQDKRTDQLVHRVRNNIVPAVTRGSGVIVNVGGITAAFIDFADRIGQRLPLFVGVVIVLSFLLLMVVFRSVLVPLKAAVMNLLSIGAAYGVIVAVFGSFVLGDSRVLKLLGLGLSTAVLVDATIVRLVLVPATMELLGDANWWLPKWLERRLPDLHLEGDAAPRPERDLAPVGGD